MDFTVGAIQGYSFVPELVKPEAVSEIKGTSPFSAFFNTALGLFNETNELQLKAEDLQLALATGQTDDILSVLQAQDRAYNSLNFTVQVTNKIIESYREIMRMQV